MKVDKQAIKNVDVLNAMGTITIGDERVAEQQKLNISITQECSRLQGNCTYGELTS